MSTKAIKNPSGMPAILSSYYNKGQIHDQFKAQYISVSEVDQIVELLLHHLKGSVTEPRKFECWNYP